MNRTWFRRQLLINKENPFLVKEPLRLFGHHVRVRPDMMYRRMFRAVPSRLHHASWSLGWKQPTSYPPCGPPQGIGLFGQAGRAPICASTEGETGNPHALKKGPRSLLTASEKRSTQRSISP